MVCNLKKCNRGKAKLKAVGDLKETLESKILRNVSQLQILKNCLTWKTLSFINASISILLKMVTIDFYDAFLGLNR